MPGCCAPVPSPCWAPSPWVSIVRETPWADLDLARLGALGDRDRQRQHAVAVVGADALAVQRVAEKQLAREHALRALGRDDLIALLTRRAPLTLTVSTLRSTVRSIDDASMPGRSNCTMTRRRGGRRQRSLRRRLAPRQ
jgi:hypothetical protein